jgi:hypothetical protein
MAKFKYPKLMSLVVISILSYAIFYGMETQDKIASLIPYPYLAAFIAGLLFSYGFTTPLAVGYFLTLKTDGLLLMASIGAMGVIISDLILFKIARTHFMDEFRRLEKTLIIREIEKEERLLLKPRHRRLLLYIISAVIIASPLPNELGVSMLAGLTKIKAYQLAIISFILGTLGIAGMLLIANL